MPHILIVTQHTRHDTIREIVDTRRGEDMLVPVAFLLVLRAGGFVVFLSDPHEAAHGVVVEGEADGVRAGAHLDGVAHVVFEPVVNAGLDFEFAGGVLFAAAAGEDGEGGGGEVEVD